MSEKTLVVGDTDVQIESMSVSLENECEPALEDRSDRPRTYSGSFTAEFDSEVDALDFWLWLHNGQ
jgi:hypothetical protein